MGEFKGKLAYASPEQLGQYGGKVTAKSDVYSFGLVLAETASGAKVYRTPYETRIPPNVPAELQEDILKLLEPDPAIRADGAFPAPKMERSRGITPKVLPGGGRRSNFSGGKIALISLLLCAVGVGVWQVRKVVGNRNAPVPQQSDKAKGTPTKGTGDAFDALLAKMPRANVVGDSKVNPRDELKYMWIPPGTFAMGCSSGDYECVDDEKPAHEVTITSGFWLARTDVTQGAYQHVIGSNPSINQFKGDDLPVDSVTWGEAQAYCQAIGGRLPTEAEWEYAARGAPGSTPARYGKLDDIAWHSGNSGGKTHEVGEKLPNAFGLYDMLGNVYQWTADWFGEKYYGASGRRDPAGPSNGAGETLRTLRAFSWGGTLWMARVSARSRQAPGYRNHSFGFRCVGE